MRYCLALDLKDDAQLIAEYEAHHRNVWPAVENSLQEAGITILEIYRTGNRLFMILEAGEDFSFEAKAAADAAKETVQQWEALMWRYQQALPGALPGEKWRVMERIYELKRE